MTRRNSRSDEPAHRLARLETAIIDLFVRLSRALGQPGSFGQIYGLIFISPRPLALDDIQERLQISRGSASQGLKFLREIGAIRPVETPNGRRTHYTAVAELRKLAGSFLREKIAPQLGGAEDQLRLLTELAGDLPSPERAHALQRIRILRSWNQNSRRVLPLLLRVLGG